MDFELDGKVSGRDMTTGFEVEIEDTGERFDCGPSQNVLKAMEQLRRRGIPVGCRGGGCGTCKVKVTAGNYVTKKMSRSCVTADEESNGYALACCIYPTSDLKVKVVGKMARAVVARRGVSFDFGLPAQQVEFENKET